VTEPHPPPGWYNDPSDEKRRRYWDGSAWTDRREPRQRYEYTAVKVPWPKGQIGATEEQITERLNAVAEHGWRYVGSFGAGHGALELLIFERPVDD
jgi:hypothetical protein